MPLSTLSLWHLFRLIGSVNSKISEINFICQDIGSVNFFSCDFMFTLSIYSKIAGCLFITDMRLSLKGPRLYKAVHCCLSVSRAMASCSYFQLPCFVASTLEVLRS